MSDEEQPIEDAVLVNESKLPEEPQAQPAAPVMIPAEKKFLAIGLVKPLPDFMALYLLHLRHGWDLATYFVDETEGRDETLITQTGFEVIYALNTRPENLAAALLTTDLFFLLANTPTQFPGPIQMFSVTEESETRIMEVTPKIQDGKMTMDEKIHRIINYRRVEQHPKSMSSILMTALYFEEIKTWIHLDSASSLRIQQYPWQLEYKGNVLEQKAQEHFYTKFVACLQVLDSLPSFASKAAVKLHEALEAVPRTFEAMTKFMHEPMPE